MLDKFDVGDLELFEKDGSYDGWDANENQLVQTYLEEMAYYWK